MRNNETDHSETRQTSKWVIGVLLIVLLLSYGWRFLMFFVDGLWRF